MSNVRPVLAVVSPFVDKSHGTERCLTEWLARLTPAFEIHLYSQRVEDIDLSGIVWHRVPRLRAPQLLSYLWWFAGNHVRRAWDRRIGGLHPDLIFSPGINCLDANAISVHVVFAEYRCQNEANLRLLGHSIRNWPRLLHRKLYYLLIAWLERRVYENSENSLLLTSARTSQLLEKHYGRKDHFPIVYAGLDHEVFNPQVCMRLRGAARRKLRLEENQIAVLLVGNDWRNKGLPVLLEALARLQDLNVCLLVVGLDDPSPYREVITNLGLNERVRFLPPRKDIEFYYAAADIYAGPSREDTFALPPAEAMACGLPVIASVYMGVSEIITDGMDGLLLRDPSDAETLAALIRKLCKGPEIRQRLGERAAETTRQYTWERSGIELRDILLQVLQSKNARAAFQSGEQMHP